MTGTASRGEVAVAVWDILEPDNSSIYIASIIHMVLRTKRVYVEVTKLWNITIYVKLWNIAIRV